jgi:hypothetical protein
VEAEGYRVLLRPKDPGYGGRTPDLGSQAKMNNLFPPVVPDCRNWPLANKCGHHRVELFECPPWSALRDAGKALELAAYPVAPP